MALKVGVVGLSGIGTTHSRCYANDDLADLVAVCDLEKERADTLAEQFRVKAYYSLKDMLDDQPDLDIVDVSTGGNENGSWHYEPACRLWRRGSTCSLKNRFQMISAKRGKWSLKLKKIIYTSVAI